MIPPQRSGRGLTENLVEFLMHFLVDFVREMLVELSLEVLHLKTDFPHLFTKHTNQEDFPPSRDSLVGGSKFDQEGNFYFDDETTNSYDEKKPSAYYSDQNTWTETADLVQENFALDNEYAVKRRL
ncbi:unnamed protein product [Meganyctiphanes norvegica]|uniref:Uncharacterized protein n=1 Tax=Meganyctiphanes norvegica TaxID=48144 RepID=A0AAV2RHJ2_MEGNR